MEPYESLFVTETGYGDDDLVTADLIERVNAYFLNGPGPDSMYYYSMSPTLWDGITYKEMRENNHRVYKDVEEYLNQDLHYKWVQVRELFAKGDDSALNTMLEYVTLDNPPERPESHFLEQQQEAARAKLKAEKAARPSNWPAKVFALGLALVICGTILSPGHIWFLSMYTGGFIPVIIATASKCRRNMK